MSVKQPVILNSTELFRDFVRVIELVPYSADPIIVILKGHLVIEDLLYRFIKEIAQRPDLIISARLRFEQLLNIVEAFAPLRVSTWVWGETRTLNKLRNTLAHSLDNKKATALLESFTQSVLSHPHTFKPKGEGSEEPNKLFLAILALHTQLSFDLNMKIKMPTILDGLYDKYKQDPESNGITEQSPTASPPDQVVK